MEETDHGPAEESPDGGERRSAPERQRNLLAGAGGDGEAGHRRARSVRDRGRARPSLRSGPKARLHRQPEAGARSVRQGGSGSADRRGRGGMAIHQPRPARPDRPSRPDFDGGELVRAMARTRRHAQSERLPDQGRRALQHAVERDFHRRTVQAEAWAVADARARRARRLARPCLRSGLGAGPGPGDRGENRRRFPPAQGDPGRLRRRLHGDVQRDHPRRAPVSARRVQGTAVAVGSLCGGPRSPRGGRSRGL